MTHILLIRHATTDAVGQLIAGWQPGWHLNATGKKQAELLAERLSPLPIKAVYTSPLERAVETATIIADRHFLQPQTVNDLGEVRFGEWEGLALSELDNFPEWKHFNSSRGTAGTPGGELMTERQARIVSQLDQLRQKHPGEVIAVVSHADPLRSAIVSYLGAPLESMLRFELSPASVSLVESAEWGARVLCLNETGDVPL
jgi:broad specificity phosphatase PhoE